MGFQNEFDGGYGLLFDGRWNAPSRLPSPTARRRPLSVLEMLVRMQDPDLLPGTAMLRRAAPDDLTIEDLSLGDLPNDGRDQEPWLQGRSDEWRGALRTPLVRRHRSSRRSRIRPT